MKKCSYCGKQYPDEVSVCPIDGQPVENKKNIAKPFIPERRAFDARLISPILSAGKYRIFAERSDLIFILIEGGSKSVLEAVVPLLGPAGSLISLTFWLFNRKKAKTSLKHIEEGNPEDQLRADERNFKLYLAEIREAAFELPTFISTNGKAGRLNLSIRHGEKMKFEFDAPKEMKNAIYLLTSLLASNLKVNVKWNEQKGRFEKVKTT